MLQDCTCSSVSLGKVESTRCGENMGQIQLGAFYQPSMLTQTTPDANLTALLASDAAVQAKANWTACLNGAATTGPIQLTPEVKGWEQSGGDAVTWGEDVDPDGMPTKVRDNPIQINITFRGAKAAVNAQLDALRCLAQNNDLRLFLFNTAGEVIGQGSTIKGFAVDYLNMAPRTIGMRDEPDSDVLTVYIPADEWRAMKKLACAYSTGTTAGPWKGIDLLAIS